jgi:tRNA pseudouridine38-40 synthase
MPRLALLIEYDGTSYAGWQRQANAVTVQEVLETAAQSVVQTTVSVMGSGRTDAGVHARGQVAHIDIPPSSRMTGDLFARALNACLPKDVRIRNAAFVREDFHARFDAVRREYVYTVLLQAAHSVFRRRYAWSVGSSFKPELLDAAAAPFLGTHDFTTFSKLNATTKHYVCAVEQAEWREIERGVWQFRIAANRFVYGMVRSVVGAMAEVARGKRTPQEIAGALALRDRSLASPLAPAAGLILWRAEYADDPFAEVYRLPREDDIRIV